MTPDPTDALRAEEEEERERHDVLYVEEREQYGLEMEPWDWEKIDAPGEPDSAYIASVRRLGDLRGRVVLDMGCGTGWLSVILAKRGAERVDGFDISGEAVKTAQRRAEINGVSDVCTFREGSAYEVPFPDDAYDVVAGQAIIHHLRNKDVVARELDRVLRSGGVAVFNEPFGQVRLFERVRQLLPIASDTDDPDHWKDKVTLQQLQPFRERFEVEVQEFELLQGFARYAPFLQGPLTSLDRLLLAALPPLRKLARGIVVVVRKP